MLNLGNVKLHDIKIKYLSTKTDKYNNEFSYYRIENENFASKVDDIIKNVEDNISFPWFLGKENNYLLRIKKRYLKDDEKISGEATINLKLYEYQNKKGYYINKIEFK